MEVVSFAHFTLDHDSDQPLHLQLQEELLRQLRALPANGGYRLPSERFLAEMFQINRVTVHRAYMELLKNRLVRRNPDKSLSVATGAKKRLQGSFPIIGLLMPYRFSDYVESRGQRSFQYIKGIVDRAETLGVSILTLQLPQPDATHEVIRDFIDERCAMLTGLIHLGGRAQNADEVLAEILAYQGIPQIFISGDTGLPHVGAVCSDPTTGAQELAREAVRLNFRTFGMVFRQDYSGYYFEYAAAKRAPVVSKVLRDAGLQMMKNWNIIQYSDEQFDPSVMPGLDNIPDLIWCISDTLATGLANYLRDNGIRVPEDVSVVGFNGFFCQNCPQERVATIMHPFYRLGETAVDMLLKYFEHGISEENRYVMLDTELVHGTTLRKEPLNSK